MRGQIFGMGKIGNGRKERIGRRTEEWMGRGRGEREGRGGREEERIGKEMRNIGKGEGRMRRRNR